MTTGHKAVSILELNFKQFPLMEKQELIGANGVYTLRKHNDSLRLVQRKPLSTCDDTAFSEGAVYSVNYCQRSSAPEPPAPGALLRFYFEQRLQRTVHGRW